MTSKMKVAAILFVALTTPALAHSVRQQPVDQLPDPASFVAIGPDTGASETVSRQQFDAAWHARRMER